jgi:hypothetical protein
MYSSLFKEFQMRKETWPWLQKVAQRPSGFPFSDIHGWEATAGQNVKRKSVNKRIIVTQNKKCYLWHFNPKWDFWYRGFCKGLKKHIIRMVDEEDLFPQFN